MEKGNQKSGIGLMIRGLAMGIAEVIPGVSGGTIAFITGIYANLLNSIKSVNFNLIKLLSKGEIASVWKQVNGRFLLFLLLGMGIGVIFGVFFITHVLETSPEPLWGFFFGLVLASVGYMWTQITSFKARYIALFILGAMLSYAVTTLTPAGGNTSLPFVFFSGAFAISALILPGISGSFILLLLGMYGIIIPEIKTVLANPNSESLILVSVFALGCLTGLLSFSRVLSYTFKHYADSTLAALTGIMLGSLPKIWPWRNPSLLLDKETGENFVPDLNSFQFSDLENAKLLDEINVLPAGYFSEPRVLVTATAFSIGLLLIYGAYRLQKTEVGN